VLAREAAEDEAASVHWQGCVPAGTTGGPRCLPAALPCCAWCEATPPGAGRMHTQAHASFSLV